MKLLLSRIFKEKWYLFLFILSLVVLLSLYAIKGSYSRYAQDDYCYGYRVKDYGFWNTQIRSYLYPTEFNSNRYSLTFINSLVEILGGAKIVPLLPVIEIIAWLISLAYLINHLLNGKKVFSYKAISVLIAEMVTFFTFYLAGNLYQILFWLSGMQPYLTPMILNTIILGRLLVLSRSPSLKPNHFFEIALLCLFAGGFSETTSLWMFVCLGIVFITIFIARKHSTHTRSGIQLVITAISTTGVALMILAICPANYYRAAHWSQPDFHTLVSMSLFFGKEFILNTVKSKPLPFLIVMAFGFWLGNLIEPGIVKKPKNYLITFIFAVIILFTLSVTTMLPTEYSMSAYPGDRALLPALFSLIVFFVFTGWLGSKFIISLRPMLARNIFFRTMTLIIGLVILIYLDRTIPLVYEKLPLYKERAQAWDIRDQMVLDEKEMGQTIVVIPQFDSVYGITELVPDPNSYINICAAKYYGVEGIVAIENYRGIPIYPLGK